MLLLMMLAPSGITAKGDNANAVEARKMFDRVYDLVFGPRGSQLTYSVNIIGLYKTTGRIIYKEKKMSYQESRYSSWQDGVTAYMVDKKKKTVNIHRADDDSKDEYLAKFKYDVRDFDFSYRIQGDYYELTAHVRNSSFFGIRRVTALLRRSNLYPVSLNIKLAVFSTTVKISDFKPGGIDDSVFQFPRSRFADYEYIDHRGR